MQNYIKNFNYGLENKKIFFIFAESKLKADVKIYKNANRVLQYRN